MIDAPGRMPIAGLKGTIAAVAAMILSAGLILNAVVTMEKGVVMTAGHLVKTVMTGGPRRAPETAAGHVKSGSRFPIQQARWMRTVLQRRVRKVGIGQVPRERFLSFTLQKKKKKKRSQKKAIHRKSWFFDVCSASMRCMVVAG